MRSAFLGFGSEAALRHIADGLADGLFTTDAEGRVTYWNGAAERITGWSAAEAIGTNCSILAGDAVNGCSCGLGPIKCGLALSGRSSKQCTVRTRDGRLLVIVKSAVPIRDASGEAIGALESFTPVRAEADAGAVPAAGSCGLVGGHPAMRELYRMVELVAASSATVMIVGESGSGKDLVAEAIHRSSPRAGRRLVRVACASLEAPLDGDGSRPGPAGEARGGTLLLDEVGDLSAAAQLEVLRFLEQREAARASGAADDVRLLCTTHCDLRTMVDARKFRADLYFRLCVFPVRVPALREHLEDAPLIAEQFLARRTPPLSLSPDAAYALMARAWPGNVRELRNALEFAALRAGGGPVSSADLPPDPAAGTSEQQIDERARLAEALARSGGNRTLAAQSLGISRVTLWKRLKRHGVR